MSYLERIRTIEKNEELKKALVAVVNKMQELTRVMYADPRLELNPASTKAATASPTKRRKRAAAAPKKKSLNKKKKAKKTKKKVARKKK